MKRVKAYVSVIVILANAILLPGCWNYREINQLAIVSGLAVDKGSRDGTYLVTFEIVDFKGGSKDGKTESERIESEGNTIFDAVRNAIRISAKRLYWSHASITILSQDIAREGIIQTLDFINRDAEPREQMHILISKEKTAKELFELQSITTDVRAFEIEEMIESRKPLAKAPGAQIHDIINMLSGEGISVTLPAIGIVTNRGEKTAELSGTALFAKDKLIGFLDAEDTKYFLFIRNQIKLGLLTLKESPKSLYDNITLEIFGSKTKLTPVNSNGKMTMNIDVNTKVNIGEVDISKNLIDEKGREAVKKKAEKMLETNIENIIRKVQEEYGVDCFGFGSTIKKEKPDLWRKIADNWQNFFTNMDVNVKAQINIKGSGLTSKTIKIGD